MLTVNELVFNGVGKEVVMSCKKDISEGDEIAGFGVEVRKYAGPVICTLNDQTLRIETAPKENANGVFVRDKVDAITIGKARPGQFIVSDQFGGCDFTMLRDPGGTVYGAHVFVDNGKPQFRQALQNPPQHWDNLGGWSSLGHLRRWTGDTSPVALLAIGFVQATTIQIVVLGIRGYPGKIADVSVRPIINY